uniref:Nucleocapsid n=1 Tax=Raton olivaceo morbillivirus TaxID=2928189 RepID=A0A9N7AAZ2_9MONO|nr:TPA_asm: nucleocapsid protein [Raton olivaceo morbillivirus]
MSTLFSTLKNFKKSKLSGVIPSGGGASLTGLKTTVIVPVPTDQDIALRWKLTTSLVKIIWNPDASMSIVIGAMISLLSIFVENPTGLIQRIFNDPDLNIKIVEVIWADDNEDDLTFASRGADLTEQASNYFRLTMELLGFRRTVAPFENNKEVPYRVDDAEEFQLLLSSILAQIWILLAKAVTAPDTAAEAEGRRWTKFVQQRRVLASLRFSKEWLDTCRNRIAESLGIRRYMVGLMIDIKRTPGMRPRIGELILDIANYVEEAGIAGFILTIKFGIETALPALALREFASELNTLENLMVLYRDLGDNAPYMLLLEMSAQNKFCPSNYPLMWSYSMGVGAQIERSIGGLNYNRPYFELPYFRLGQEMVRRSAGTVNPATADAIGINPADKDLLKEVVDAAQTQTSEVSRPVNPTGLTFMQLRDEIQAHIQSYEAADRSRSRETYPSTKPFDSEVIRGSTSNIPTQLTDLSSNQPRSSGESGLALLKTLVKPTTDQSDSDVQPHLYNDKSLLD